MITAELIIGALGASVSLGSGLLKLIKDRASAQQVTIPMGLTSFEGQLLGVRKAHDPVDGAESDLRPPTQPSSPPVEKR